MSYLNRDGVKLYYEDHGKGEVTILLSHGYSASSSMWKNQVATFKENYRAITWDMRGHGRSDSPDDPAFYSRIHTIEDMRGILDECGVNRVVVGGQSLGGYMSLAFHLQYRARVSALMLFDTGPGYRKDLARDAWNEMAGKRALDFEKNGLAALGVGQEVRMASHRSAQGLAHAARGMLAQSGDDIIESLPSIEVPTLVLVGEQDEAFIAPTDYMANKIRGAQKVTIANAGHASNVDQPGAFNRAVGDFLHSTV